MTPTRRHAPPAAVVPAEAAKTITKGDVIRIVPERGPERLMLVDHVEQHIITLNDLDLAIHDITAHLHGSEAAQAVRIAKALEEAAVADWDDGDGRCLVIPVSQIAPIAERLLREGDPS